MTVVLSFTISCTHLIMQSNCNHISLLTASSLVCKFLILLSFHLSCSAVLTAGHVRCGSPLIFDNVVTISFASFSLRLASSRSFASSRAHVFTIRVWLEDASLFDSCSA